MENPQVIPPDQWHVAIKHNRRNHPPGYIFQPAGTDLEQARHIAADVALKHVPPVTGGSKGRRVFQTSPDNWVVEVANVISGTVYFEVYVALLTAATTT